MNYFELFEIPISYNLNEANLARCYLQKQKKVHPDMQNSVSEHSAFLNTAYKTLLDPVSRGEYLLRLQGVDIDSMPSVLAQEMFKMRERYEGLSSRDEKIKFQHELLEKTNGLIELLKNTNDMNSFKETFSLLRFINSFLEKVKIDVYSRN